jgi:hypothetical protein
LHTFDVEEAIFVSNCQAFNKVAINSLDVMRSYVEDSEEKHSVSYLSVEPLRLVEWQYAYFRTEPSEDVSAHRHDNNHGINRQDKTCTSGYPYGVLEAVQRR